MRPKSLLLLVLALGCGLVASIGISRVIDSRQPSAESFGETVEIYVAMTKISTGDPISAQMVRLEPWPKEKVESLEGAITESEDLFGRRPRTTVFRGEPILQQKLLKTDSLASASERIPEGYRIKTIRVDAESGNSGLILPGDRVDVQVYLRRDVANGIPQDSVHTFLQNVKVFAVDDILDRTADKDKPTLNAKTISLLLTSRQADLATLASKKGIIQLVGRSATDTEDVTSEGVILRDIVSGSTTSADRTAALGLGKPSWARVKQEERPTPRNDQPQNNQHQKKTLAMEPAQQHQMVVMRGPAISVVRFKDGKLISEESLGVLSAARASTTKRSGISLKLGHSQQKDEPDQEIFKHDQDHLGNDSNGESD